MSAMVAERVRAQVDALAGTGLDLATFCHTAVEVVRRALPCTAVCMGTTDPATQLLTSTTKWGALDGSHDPEWAYYEYEIEDVYDFRDVARRPGSVVGLAIETGGDLRRSRRYEELYRPVWDFSDELRMALRVDDATWGVLALFHDAGRSFTPAEQGFLSGLGPSFARGVRTGLLAEAGSTLEASPVDGPAVLVVDAHGELERATPGAAARCADLSGRPLDAGQLPTVVQTLVAAARRYAAGLTTTAPRARVRTRGGQWIVVHASPLVSRTGLGTDVVVTIDAAGPPEILPLLMASYAFTARERDVVALVLRGVDTAEIAGSLHLSAYTVQDHLKKIFAKAGVRSRRELIARINSDHYIPRLVEGAGLSPTGWFAG